MGLIIRFVVVSNHLFHLVCQPANSQNGMVAASHLVNTFVEETARAINSTTGVATDDNSCTRRVLNDSPVMKYKWQITVAALLMLLETENQSRFVSMLVCMYLCEWFVLSRYLLS